AAGGDTFVSRRVPAAGWLVPGAGPSDLSHEAASQERESRRGFALKTIRLHSTVLSWGAGEGAWWLSSGLREIQLLRLPGASALRSFDLKPPVSSVRTGWRHSQGCFLSI